MGLFDSVIGTAEANPDVPTPFSITIDEREEFVPFDASVGKNTGIGSGNNDSTTGGSGSGNKNEQGNGAGGGGSSWGFDGDRKEVNPLAFAHIEEPMIIEKVKESDEISIDIGGDMSDFITDITEPLVTTDTSLPTKEIVIGEISPIIHESNEGLILVPEVSIIPAIDILNTDTSPIDVSSIDGSDTSDNKSILVSTDIPVTATTIELLDEKISGFVAELEELKAEGEILLHKKETVIEKLEEEMKDLEKEVKKIQADEKKIDGDSKNTDILTFVDIENPIIVEKTEESDEVSIDILNSGTQLIEKDSIGIDTANSTSTEALSIANTEPVLLSNDMPVTAVILEPLDEKISGFVAELEELKAEDEVLLHEKEITIERLEKEMKDLEKEVKKIQADEKKIDSMIASFSNTIKIK